MNTQADEIDKLMDSGFDLVESGSLTEARALFERVCAQDAGNAEAWMMRGSVDAELGSTDQALTELNKAIELDPSLPESFYYLASIHRTGGDLHEALSCIEKAMALDAEYGEAFLLGGAIYGLLEQLDQSEQCCRKAAAMLPDSPDAHINLGHVLLQRGNPGEACQQFAVAAQLQPDSLDTWTLLGRLYAQLNDLAKSAEAYRAVLRLKPDTGEAYYGMGFAAYQQGRHEEAVVNFSRALDIDPHYVQAADSLGTAYQAMGRYDDALEVFQRVLDTDPAHAEALFGKARSLIELARLAEAVPLLQQALQVRPDYLEAHLNLAATLIGFDQPAEAMQCCNRALDVQPDCLDAIALAARIELQAGQAEQAYQRLRPHIASAGQHVNLGIAYGDICRDLDRPEEAIGALEALQASEQSLSVVNRRKVQFSLGSLYDKMHEFGKAFASYKAGNDLRSMPWDPLTNKSQVDSIIEVFSQEFLASAPRAGVRSEKPVFVLGMPRSGTSLVEQILASHPAVYGAGELTDLFNLAAGLPAVLGTDLRFPQCMTRINQRAVDSLAQSYLAQLDELSLAAERVTDKMPGNFSFLGLIELLFPGARVIHCLRDPLDTCLSCYFQDFAMSQPYSFNLSHLGAFYRGYERLMAHWKDVLMLPMLDVSYEDMIANQEAVSRRLVEFCGLDWDERCLQFHETERFIATSSYAQVQRPIYSSSVKRWENYKEHLSPLIESLQANRNL